MDISLLRDIALFILSLGLIVCIILQQRGSSGGLGSSVFGGSGSSPTLQRRGLERTIFIVTWIIAIAIFLLSVLRLWS